MALSRPGSIQPENRKHGPLSLAQIHRLLRPLRNKINSLAISLHNGKSLASNVGSGPTLSGPLPSKARGKSSSYNVKYGASKTSGNPSLSTGASAKAGFSPLAMLPHPSRFQSSSLANSGAWNASTLIHGVPIIEMSRKIYGVVESFRNVVSRAYGDEFLRRSDDVRSLMEIAVSIVGGDIEASVIELLSQEESNMALEDQEDADLGCAALASDSDEDETSVIDGCYEQIPEHLRRWAIVPHAVKMILIHVPVDLPCLWEACLDVTVEFATRNDSIPFLDQLLSYALSARGSRHLNFANSNYLVNLLRKPNAPSRPLAQVWTERTFVDQVLEVMGAIDSKHVDSIWCTLGVRLLWTNISGDLEALLSLTLGLCDTSLTTQKSLDQLQTWVKGVLGRSVNSYCVPGTPIVAPQQYVEMLFQMATILWKRGALPGAGLKPSEPDETLESIKSLSTCVASHALTLVTPMSSIRSEIHHLLEQLSSNSQPSTFTTLLQAFASRPEDEENIDTMPNSAFALAHAEALRKSGFSRLEAFLLAGALAMTEKARESDFSDQDQVEEGIILLDAALNGVEAGRVGCDWKWDSQWGWVVPTPARSVYHPVRLAQATGARSLSKRPRSQQNPEDHNTRAYASDSSSQTDPRMGNQRTRKRLKVSSTWSQKNRISSDSESSVRNATPPSSLAPLGSNLEASGSDTNNHRRARNGSLDQQSAPYTNPHHQNANPNSGLRRKSPVKMIRKPLPRDRSVIPSLTTSIIGSIGSQEKSRTPAAPSHNHCNQTSRIPPYSSSRGIHRVASFTGYPVRPSRKKPQSDRDELDLLAASSSPKATEKSSSEDALVAF